jgi:L-seryl-tRNA(Ser) seleniumtransferase
MLHLRQRGSDLDGAHQGEFVTRNVNGTIDGDNVRLSSLYDESHGDALSFTFSGKWAADQMSGTIDMGEYLTATWTARRSTPASAGNS